MSRKPEIPITNRLGPNTLKALPAMHRASEKAWQEVSTILNNICEVVFRLDTLANYIEVYDGVTGLAGYAPSEMKGRSVFDFLHPDEHALVASVISDNLYSGAVVKNFRHRFLHKDGHWIWLNTSGQSQLNEEGVPVAIIGVSYDITRNVEDEQTLKNEQEKYSRLFFSHPLPLLVYDWDTQEVLDVNEACLNLYGYTREEMLQMNVSDIRPADDLSHFISRLELDKQQFPGHKEYLKGYTHHKRKDGNSFFAEIDSYHLNFNGRSAILASIRDITEKRNTQEQNRYLASIVDNVSDAIYTCDMGLNIISWNRAAEEMYGISAADAIGKTLGHFLEPVYETGSREQVINEVNTNGFWKGEVSFRHPVSGAVITLLSSVTTLKNSKLQPNAFVITSKDISERKMAEKIISESESRFRAMADSAPVMIWVTNEHDNTIYYNQGWLNFTGKTLTEEISEQWEYKVHPEDRPGAMVEYYKAVAHKRPFTIEYRLRKNDGTYHWVIDRGSPRFLPDGSFVGYTGVCFNIQDRREVEARLLNIEQEKQKLVTRAGIEGQEKEREEIGRELHDNVNQLISSAKLYMEVVKRETEGGEEMVNRSIETLNLAIQEIRRLSKNLTPPTLDLGINDAIEELIDEVHLSRTLSITFTSCREAETGINAEISLTLFRIVQEQVNNILKHAEAGSAAIKLEKENNLVQLTITDNGKGFDTSLRRKGVGLTNITNRASLHNGRVEIISTPGYGCTLKVCIPVA
ncbi:MAG: PAS domain S-box protein [Dinghuibacter sp.]|nr:PAS domain S-box protein [Dinghuibacter sp.]